MKWTKENDEILKFHIKNGKHHHEIGVLMNISYGGVRNRCRRLKLTIIYHKENTCLNCSKSFIDYISNLRKFCSKNCAASYNNSNRILNDFTKEKIRKSKIGVKRNKTTITSIIKPLITERTCRSCNELKNIKKHKSICDECRNTYYKYYRPLCEFTFSHKDYPNKFNIDLINKYGLYSPKNKRNNLNGISRDHLYSVRDGFLNKIQPEIINHPANCQFIKHSDNNIKSYKSIITLVELLERIKKW